MIDEAGRKESEWQEYCSEFRGDGSDLEGIFLERQSEGKVGVMSPGGNGNIPLLFSRGGALAEAWENSLIALAARGGFVRTQYDDKNSENGLYLSPPSIDATMSVIVEAPSSDPMIHKSFPGGLEDLEEYRQEVLDGIKDHWVRDQNNPDDKRWEYTYHERMFGYKVPGLKGSIDQVENMIGNLARSPITRRAQATSWKVWEDLNISDPACFQSLWGRILRTNDEFKFYSNESDGEQKLNLNMRFRSRDAYDAAFMNNFAFINLAEYMAGEISGRQGEKVELGRFEDKSDSYHIYGKRLEDFGSRFVKSISNRSFEDRTWDRAFVQPFFDAAKSTIIEKVKAQDLKYCDQGLK
ncbi:hypothetical protein HN903_00440 [archaeon]|jgi:thymidylate synthase|nr:hypothetical protein [archaeon]MBT7128203.1 hypothetical protein [archaeon]